MFLEADVVFGLSDSKEIKIKVSYYTEHGPSEDCVYITKDMLKEVLESGE